MAEILIIILAEHNMPINLADHFTKLVSNKLVFPDSVFLRVCAARSPCSLKVVIARIVTNFFSRNLTGLSSAPSAKERRQSGSALMHHDAKQCPSDGFFYAHLTPMKDSYIPGQPGKFRAPGHPEELSSRV